MTYTYSFDDALANELYIDLHNSVAGDLLYDKEVDLRPFVTNDLFQKFIATNDFNELDNRLYNLAYSAIVGMEGGQANWGTFTYKIDNKSLTLISIMQESKKYGPVITFCLPEEV